MVLCGLAGWRVLCWAICPISFKFSVWPPGHTLLTGGTGWESSVLSSVPHLFQVFSLTTRAYFVDWWNRLREFCAELCTPSVSSFQSDHHVILCWLVEQAERVLCWALYPICFKFSIWSPCNTMLTGGTVLLYTPCLSIFQSDHHVILCWLMKQAERVLCWAVKPTSLLVITFWSDYCVVLCWLVQCTMIWVWFSIQITVVCIILLQLMFLVTIIYLKDFVQNSLDRVALFIDILI